MKSSLEAIGGVWYKCESGVAGLERQLIELLGWGVNLVRCEGWVLIDGVMEVSVLSFGVVMKNMVRVQILISAPTV